GFGLRARPVQPREPASLRLWRRRTRRLRWPHAVWVSGHLPLSESSFATSHPNPSFAPSRPAALASNRGICPPPAALRPAPNPPLPQSPAADASRPAGGGLAPLASRQAQPARFSRGGDPPKGDRG